MKTEITWFDEMRKYKPDITREEADFILWEKTCFPFNAERTLSQIKEYLTTKQ